MKQVNWKAFLPHVIAVAIFLLVALIFCKPALEGKVLNQSDVMHWKGMVQDMENYKARHGYYPLWNNNLFGGMPGYQVTLETANPITPLYLHALFTAFLPKPLNMFFLLCMGFYFLSQVVGIRPWLGIMGALAYAYATYSPIIVAVGHDTKMMAMGYMPAVIGALWLIFQRKYLWGSALTAVFTAMLLGMNHLQITYYTLLIALAMGIGFAIQWMMAGDYRHLLKAASLAILTGAIGATTHLVTLATTNDYTKASMRSGTLAQDTTTAAGKANGLPIDYAFAWSYGPTETFTLLIPGIYGGGSADPYPAPSAMLEKMTEMGVPENQIMELMRYFPMYWGPQQLGTSGPVYIGAIIFFLFLFGMVYLKTPNKWWILGISVFAILLSWGKNFMGFNEFLFQYLPFYNKFRAPTMVLVIPQLLFAFTAILGVEQLLNEKDKANAFTAWKRTGILAGGILLLLIGLYASFDYLRPDDRSIFQQLTGGNTEAMNGLLNALKTDRKALFSADLLRSFVLTLLAAGLLWAYIKNKLKPNVLVYALLVLSSFDILQIGKRYLNENNFMEEEDMANAYFSPSPVDQAIKQDTGYYRVINLSMDVFNDAITSYHHRSVGGYHPAKLSIMEDLLNFQLRNKQPMNKRVLDMLDTKYIITRNEQTGQPAYRLNPDALGACWLVKHVQTEKGPAAVMKALDNLNPKDTAIIDAAFAQNLVQPVPDSTASVQLVAHDNDEMIYRSSSSTPQFAVFSEIFYNRGWKAYIDNKETEILQTNYVLRGLSLPAGTHEIRFEFKPDSYYNSKKATISASVLTWLLLLGALAQGLIRKKQTA
jgi:hypothetical protein